MDLMGGVDCEVNEELARCSHAKGGGQRLNICAQTPQRVSTVK